MTIGALEAMARRAPWPRVHLSPRPLRLSWQGGSGGQCDCDCDCACPVGVVGFPDPFPAPLSCYVELTPECNNRCPGCGNVFAPHRRQGLPAPLSLHEWEIVLGKIAGWAHAVKITGGEPTLYPHLVEILHLLEQSGLHFTLFTNARWPDPEKVLGLLTARPHFRGLLVSLHGAEASVHEAFSGVPGSFVEAVRNVRRAVAAGLSVAISTVLTEVNAGQVEQVVDLALSLGAHHVVFNRYVGAASSPLNPTPDQLRAGLAAVESLRAAGVPVRFGNCIPRCFYPSSSTGCLAGFSFCTVDPWGNVRPCNHTPQLVGNLLEQPLQEIWQSAAMQQWRQMTPGECSDCAEFSTCHGGCRAAAVLSQERVDPLVRGPEHLEAAELPRQELPLYEGLYPRAQFVLQEQQAQCLLLHEGQYCLLPLEAVPPLSALDGRHTLEEIGVSFGGGAVDMVGWLYQHGFVAMAE